MGNRIKLVLVVTVCGTTQKQHTILSCMMMHALKCVLLLKYVNSTKQLNGLVKKKYVEMN